MKDVFELGLMMFGLIGLLIFLPAISFAISYFGGWITSIVIGKQLAFALNMIFNTTYFQPAMIKWYAGALGWIGGFFKAANTNIKSRD